MSELKGNLTIPSIMGYEGNKNSPWNLQFYDSILRQGVTIGMGINFKSKNLIVVLHFQKILVHRNVSRICTPKIRVRGISGKHLVSNKKKKKKKRICKSPLDLQLRIV